MGPHIKPKRPTRKGRDLGVQLFPPAEKYYCRIEESSIQAERPCYFGCVFIKLSLDGPT
jgi:hypothetical protein